MPVSGKEMIRLLERNGWICDHVSGSHHHMRKGRRLVCVPCHNRDLKKGMEMKIRKLTGVKK